MENSSKSNRVSRVVVSALTFAMTSLALGAAAFAAPPDPGGTGAAMGSVQTGITAWVATYGVPAIVAVLLVGVGIALLIKFTRKSKGAI